MWTAQQKSLQRKKNSALPKATSIESIPVESIQRSMGNQGLTEYLFSSFQVSDPKDASEQEAEQVADSVMAKEPISDLDAPIQRRTEAGEVQRAEESRASQEQASFASSSASDMPAEVQGRMESAFGRSFGEVHLHHDASADTLSRSLHADAFTKGNDIYFRQDAYNMSSEQGQHLLAHELAHVAQNDGGLHRAPPTQGQPPATPTQGQAPPTQTPSQQPTQTPLEASANQLQKLAEDELFCKFVELIQKNKAVIRAAANLDPTKADQKVAVEGSSTLDKIADGIDYADGLVGLGGDITGLTSDIPDSKKTEQELQDDDSSPSTQDKIGAATDSFSAAMSVASTGIDTYQKFSDHSEQKDKRSQLGLAAEGMSAKDKWEIAGNVLGSAGSIVGAGASISSAAGGDETKTAKAGLAGDSLSMVSDIIGIGTGSADVHEARTKNNKARAQIITLLKKAADYEKSDPEKLAKIQALEAQVSSDKDENGNLKFNQSVDTLLTGDFSEKTKNVLKRAKILNSTRQVSREQKNEKAWDLGGSVFGTISDAISMTSDIFDFKNNKKISAIFSVIGGFASIAGGLFDMGKKIYDKHAEKKRESGAEAYAKGVLTNLADSLDSAKAAVTVSELKQETTPLTDEPKIESGQIYSDCYMSLDAGNVDMLDFLLALQGAGAAQAAQAQQSTTQSQQTPPSPAPPTHAKQIKQAVMTGYVKH